MFASCWSARGFVLRRKFSFQRLQWEEHSPLSQPLLLVYMKFSFFIPNIPVLQRCCIVYTDRLCPSRYALRNRMYLTDGAWCVDEYRACLLRRLL